MVFMLLMRLTAVLARTLIRSLTLLLVTIARILNVLVTPFVCLFKRFLSYSHANYAILKHFPFYFSTRTHNTRTSQCFRFRHWRRQFNYYSLRLFRRTLMMLLLQLLLLETHSTNASCLSLTYVLKIIWLWVLSVTLAFTTLHVNKQCQSVRTRQQHITLPMKCQLITIQILKYSLRL